MTALEEAMKTLEIDLAAPDEVEAFDTRFDRMAEVAALAERCLEELEAGAKPPAELRAALAFVLADRARWWARNMGEEEDFFAEETAVLTELRDRLPEVPKTARSKQAAGALRSSAELLRALREALEATDPDDRTRRVDSLLFETMRDPFDRLPAAFWDAHSDEDTLQAFLELGHTLLAVGIGGLRFAMLADAFFEAADPLTFPPDPKTEVLRALKKAPGRDQLE